MEEVSADIGRLFEMKFSDSLFNFLGIHCQLPRLFVNGTRSNRQAKITIYKDFPVRSANLVTPNVSNSLRPE